MEKNKDYDDTIIEFADEIDFSNVARSDRVFMRDIIKGIFRYDECMPKLTVSIFNAGAHYNVNTRGWMDSIDGPTFHKTFMDKSRKEIFDRIITYKIIPCPEDGKGPMLMFQVSKDGTIHASEKIKK